MFALSFVVYSADICHDYKVKIYWYSQGGKVRFLPNQIGSLWPKYFVQEEDVHQDVIDQFVRALFCLDVNDPYFEKSDDEIEKLFKNWKISTSVDSESLSQKFQEWRMCAKKTFHQKRLLPTFDNTLKHEIPSTSSTATPTVNTHNNRTRFCQ